MRKLIVMLGLIFCLMPIARAEDFSIIDTLKQLPSIKQGVAYSMLDNKVNYLATFDIAEWKGFTLEAGYAGDAENTNNKIVAVVSYDVFNAKKFGITWPVANLIDLRVGAYGGVGSVQVGDAVDMRGNNEWDAGISATAVSIKF